MDQLANRLFRRPHPRLAVFLLMCGDVIALIGALFLAFYLRFDGIPSQHSRDVHLDPHLLSLPFCIVIYVVVFAYFRLYKYAWRFAGLETLRNVVVANSFGVMAMVAFQRIFDGSTFPRSILVIFWIMSIAIVGGVRIILRLASLGSRYGGMAIKIIRKDLSPKRVVILGAGTMGARVIDALFDEYGDNCEIVGFLDDDINKQGIYIRDICVIGFLDKLHALLEEKSVDQVIIALPDASGSDIRSYVIACHKRRVPVKIIPALRDVGDTRVLPRLEEISVEDLLRRPAFKIDFGKIGSFLTGQRVMITGAGGSIGSEICRQVIALKPEKLILLGHGENSIFSIQQELVSKYPELEDKIRPVIASVSDEVRIDQVMNYEKPDVVFHAAAHKHVPMMESNVIEAFKNNVLGTSYVADACGRYGVKRMLLISTDKAVNPSSVMGATKWMCERIVAAMVQVYPNTTYVTVRFGNVIGSRGSVVPILHEQIKSGGPVKITHPEMTRFFMSIPEAVQLVLQAAAVGESGELCILDMGEPVRILDLAEDMIRLCGLEPGSDININFTGIRPGEKLHEELTSEDEIQVPTSCDGLSIVHCRYRLSSDEVFEMVKKVDQMVASSNEIGIRRLLSEIFPLFGEKVVGVIKAPLEL